MSIKISFLIMDLVLIRNRTMKYPAASGRGIKKRKPEMPSPQSGGVFDPPRNKLHECLKGVYDVK